MSEDRAAPTNQDMKGNRAIYPNEGSKLNTGNLLCRIAGCSAALAAIVSLCLAYIAWRGKHVEIIYLCLMFWTIVPPIWFWGEYFVVYRRFGDPTAFDSFKHGQQVSLAIWAALAFSLNGLAGAEHFKEKENPTPCCQSQQPNTPSSMPAEKDRSSATSTREASEGSFGTNKGNNPHPPVARTPLDCDSPTPEVTAAGHGTAQYSPRSPS